MILLKYYYYLHPKHLHFADLYYNGVVDVYATTLIYTVWHVIKS